MRPARLVLLGLAALWIAAPAGTAPPGDRGPDLNDLALGFTLGEYRAPLVCDIGGVPRRGLRRVRIAAGPPGAAYRTNRLQLYDLEVPSGTRCYTETGQDQPNAIGALFFSMDATSRPDTASRDFQSLMREEQQLEFVVRSGGLRMGDPGSAVRSLPEVDFAGGRAILAPVRRGSDAFRRLADFPEPRKFTLTLSAPRGARLELDLVQLELP